MSLDVVEHVGLGDGHTDSLLLPGSQVRVWLVWLAMEEGHLAVWGSLKRAAVIFYYLFYLLQLESRLRLLGWLG